MIFFLVGDLVVRAGRAPFGKPAFRGFELRGRRLGGAADYDFDVGQLDEARVIDRFSATASWRADSALTHVTVEQGADCGGDGRSGRGVQEGASLRWCHGFFTFRFGAVWRPGEVM